MGSRGDSSDGGVCGSGWGSSCLVAVVITILISIAISVLMIGLVAINRDDDGSVFSSEFYSPGDSRILSLSRFFCDAGVLELRSDSVDAELFLIDLKPPLNDTNSFTVNTFTFIQDFLSWQYHLYPNSNITINVVARSSSTGLPGLTDVYIVKGRANASLWRNLPGQRFTATTKFSEISSGSLQYNVIDEDEYYIFIENAILNILFEVNVSITFDRFQYSQPEKVIDVCDTNPQGTCALDVPYSIYGSQKFLVRTSIPPLVTDFRENIVVILHCNPRSWAYTVAILVPLIVVIMLCAVALLLVLKYFRHKQKLLREPVFIELLTN